MAAMAVLAAASMAVTSPSAMVSTKSSRVSKTISKNVLSFSARAGKRSARSVVIFVFDPRVEGVDLILDPRRGGLNEVFGKGLGGLNDGLDGIDSGLKDRFKGLGEHGHPFLGEVNPRLNRIARPTVPRILGLAFFSFFAMASAAFFS